jgi:phosphoribosylformylglycinamidine synthase
MVGLIERDTHITTSGFKDEGDAIILVGEIGNEIGASHFLKVAHYQKAGCVPVLDYAKEKAVQEAVRSLIRSRLVKSAHDCSEGGLAVAIAESCLTNRETPIGATVTIPGEASVRPEVLLFNESQSRIVISTKGTNATVVLSLLEWRGIPARKLGTVGGATLKISAAGSEFFWPVAELSRAWSDSIPLVMNS